MERKSSSLTCPWESDLEFIPNYATLQEQSEKKSKSVKIDLKPLIRKVGSSQPSEAEKARADQFVRTFLTVQRYGGRFEGR
jgi:hypothetical protein